jgi:hypothetical protein
MSDVVVDLSEASMVASRIDEGWVIFHEATKALEVAGIRWHDHGAHRPGLDRVLRGEQQHPGWFCPITQHIDPAVRLAQLMKLAERAGVKLVEDATMPIGWRIE